MKNFISTIAYLLNSNGIEYLVVGGAARQFYQKKHRTKDLDILIYNDDENTKKLQAILGNDKVIEEFKLGTIIRIVGEPYNIDFLPILDGVKHQKAKKRKKQFIHNQTVIDIIDKDDLELNLQTVQKRLNGTIKI